MNQTGHEKTEVVASFVAITIWRRRARHAEIGSLVFQHVAAISGVVESRLRVCKHLMQTREACRVRAQDS